VALQATNKFRSLIESQQRISSLETRFIRKNGAVVVLETSGVPVFNAEHRLVGYRGIDRDITERKKTEESQAFIAAIIKYSNDAIIGKTLEGIITSWNLGAENIYGYTETEVIGRHISLLVPPGHVDDTILLLDKIRAGEPVIQHETSRLRKDGKIIDVALTLSPVRDMGRSLIGVSTIARDITRQKQAEKNIVLQALRIQKLLELNRMKDAPSLELFNYSLEASLQMTESRYSLIGLISPDESVMTIHTCSQEAMLECAVVGKPMHFHIASSGVWRECIRQRKPVVLNEYTAQHPAKRGYPEGHVPITRFLGIPILDGIHVVAILAVANKQNDYEEGDINALTTLGNHLWELLYRKQAEETLKKKEEQYRSFFTTSRDCVFITSADGHWIDFNDEAVGLFGFESRGELLESRVGDRYADPEERDRHISFINEQGHSKDYSVRLQKKDGTIIHALVTAVAVKDREGHITSYQGTIRDITAQRHAEEALKFSHIILSTQQEASLDGILVVDEMGKILSYNQRFADIWQIPPDVLASRSDERALQAVLAMLLHPDEFLDRVRYLYEHHDQQSREEISLIDGRTLDRYSAPMIGKDGRYYGRVWYFRDITKQKKAADALRESEYLLNEVGRLAKVGGLELDPTTKQVYWTRETYRIHDILDHDHLDLSEALLFFDEPGRSQLALLLQRCMETGEPIDLELPLTTAKGRHLWTRIIARSVSEDGRIVKLIGAIEDITELKQAKDALEQSEEKFRGVAERSFDLILLTDKSSLLTYVFPSVTGMLGYSPEEVIGRSAFEFVHPDSLGSVQEGFLKNVEGFITEPMEVSVRKKEGGYATLEISGASIRKNGVFAGMQVIGRDITSKKADQDRIAELLKIQEEQVRIINTSPAVAFLWRAEGNWPVEMVSENISQFGYTPDDFLSGRITFAAIILPEDLSRVGSEVEYNSSHGIDEYTQQYRIFGKDRKEYWIDDFTHIRRDRSGKITHYEGIILDITERKRAEEALRESERRNAIMIGAMPDMIFIISLEGVFLDFSVPDESVLAIPADQILGKNIRDTGFPNETTETILQNVAQAIETKMLQQFDYSLDLPWGTRQYEARIVALNETEVLGIVRDITEQKKAEALQIHFREELEQQVLSRTEALNASLEEKTLLLREVHHRVKNNLQIILSLINIQIRKTEDTRLKQLMTETQNRVRAMSLVHEKLYQSEDLSCINLSGYVQSLVIQLFTSYKVDLRKVNFHLEIDNTMTDINTAIPLGLIINELVSNILKYAFPGEKKGEITISAREENEEVILSIQDNGIGFPQGFDWRQSPSLGLHLVSTLVDQIHGTIELVNAGPGTFFRIEFPTKKGGSI